MTQFCLVCNCNINDATSVNINSTSIKYSDKKLVSIVVNLLGSDLHIDHESSICGKCYSLFKLYEQAQWTAKNTEREILRAYNSNLKKKATFDKFKDRIVAKTVKNNESNKRTKFNTNNITSKNNNEVEIRDVKRKNALDKYSLKNYFENAEKNVCIASNFKYVDSNYINVDDNSRKNKNATLYQLIDDSDVNSQEYHLILPSITQMKGKTLKVINEQSKLSSPSCHKEFSTKVQLQNHSKTHSELKPFMGEICGRSYRHKQALKIHIGMHNGINPFKCSNCGKCFTQKGTLMRHMLIHTGETPFQCEICGKRFTHHTSHNMHMLSHTREKAYKCNVCNFSLLSTSHLKRHMRVHTGERPYTCPTCLKSFAQRYNLLSHQKIHYPKDNDNIKNNQK